MTHTYNPLARLASAATGATSTTYGYDGDHTLSAQTSGGTSGRHVADTQGGLPERLGTLTTVGGIASTTWYAPSSS